MVCLFWFVFWETSPSCRSYSNTTPAVQVSHFEQLILASLFISLAFVFILLHLSFVSIPTAPVSTRNSRRIILRENPHVNLSKMSTVKHKPSRDRLKRFMLHFNGVMLENALWFNELPSFLLGYELLKSRHNAFYMCYHCTWHK